MNNQSTLQTQNTNYIHTVHLNHYKQTQTTTTTKRVTGPGPGDRIGPKLVVSSAVLQMQCYQLFGMVLDSFVFMGKRPETDSRHMTPLINRFIETHEPL